ncbi:MAG: hypothetical protein M0R37_15310 [Bacteroidales bacterium]|jgi:hypothetical protein|nr:hypothetical protein [Bacteroidales bacterium]
MGAVTTVGDFLDKLTALLKLRVGLAGVTIASGWVDPGAECCIIGIDPINADGQYETMPRGRIREGYPVPCYIKASAPGSGEAAIKVARDRALAIFEQVVDQITTSNSTTATALSALGVEDAVVSTWKVTQTVEPIENGDRVTEIEFVITVSTEFTPA